MPDYRSCIEILVNDTKSIELISICSTVNNRVTRYTYWGTFILYGYNRSQDWWLQSPHILERSKTGYKKSREDKLGTETPCYSVLPMPCPMPI